jgi:glycosyltransferase involved in cell wall biosynthesis
MLSVFILKSNLRGMQYGIATYIDELIKALLVYSNLKLFIVEYHSDRYKEFSTEMLSQKYIRVSIPSSRQPYFNSITYEKKYATAVVYLLSDLMLQEENVVIQTNSFDDFWILKILKKKFPYPVLSTIIPGNRSDSDARKIRKEELDIEKMAFVSEISLSQEKEIYHLVDGIIAFTDTNKKYLVNNLGINCDKICTIHNGMEYNKNQIRSQVKKFKLKKELGFMPNEKIILFCGKIDHLSGIYFFIDAFIEACKCLDNLRLVIIGEGQLMKCLQKYHSFYGKLTLTGFLPHKMINQFYQIADAGLVQANYNHCPYTLLEMIAADIPVLLSVANGYNELFNDSQCYLVHPLSNIGENSVYINELKNAMLSIILNKKLSKWRRQNALQKLQNDYSAKFMATEMSRVYTAHCDLKI